MADLVCVKTFDSTGNAETALGLLQANGMKAIIEPSESGGMTPAAAGADTKLLVAQADVERARSLLEGKRSR